MCHPLKNILLDPLVSGETWGGLTWTITSSDDTEFSALLSRVRMTFKNAAGSSVLTLDSNIAGQITITTATAYAWSFTVEPRLLSFPEGRYSWAIETTDADGNVDKDRISGTIQIIPDPHA